MTFRQLPFEEWPRLTEIGGPLRGVEMTASPDHTIILVAEEGGAIIGYWMAFNTVHAEPLWIDEKHRHAGATAKGLWERMIQVLSLGGIGYVFAIVGDQDAETVGRMAEGIGFERLPGHLYGGAVPHDEKGV